MYNVDYVVSLGPETNHIIVTGRITERWLTKLWMPVGKRVVIIGGAIQGCELAEFLVKRGRKVAIVDTAEKLGEGLVIITKDGERQTLEADTIITAIPFQPNADLLKSLDGKVPEIYQIGDCKEPGLMPDAIADGSRIAYTI